MNKNELYNLKNQLPASMRSPKWNLFMDKCEELATLLEDKYIERIKSSFNIANGTLQDLKDLAEDVFCLSSSYIDRLYNLFITEGETEQHALELLRNELLKFPYMILNRGTKIFYEMLNSVGVWNFPMTITLCPQSDNLIQTCKSTTNIDLSSHSKNSDRTELVDVPTTEDFLAHKYIDVALDVYTDDSHSDTEYKLDSENEGVKTLDILYEADDTPHKRNLFIGLNLNKDRFSSSLFPSELAYYMLSVLNLYKKATENIIFSLINSIHIVEDSHIEGICEVKNYAVPYDERKDVVVKYLNPNRDVVYSTKPNSFSYENGSLKVVSFYEGCRYRNINIDARSTSLNENYYYIGNTDNPKDFELNRFIKISDHTGKFIIFKEVQKEVFLCDYTNDDRLWDTENNKHDVNLYFNYSSFVIRVYSTLSTADLSDYYTMDISSYKFGTQVKSMRITQDDNTLCEIIYDKPIDVIHNMYLCNVITREELNNG